MNICDMASILSKYPKTEFIMFDACFMQSIEVAYELGEYTKYIIGSPAEIPAWGAPYNELTSILFADNFSPSDLIDRYNNHYKDNYPQYGILLSVIDCTHLERFASIHRQMIEKYSESFKTANLSDVLNYFLFEEWNRQTDLPDSYDIRGVMQHIIEDATDYIYWNNELDLVVPYSISNSTWYSGYPMYASDRFMKVDSLQYSGMSMYVEQEKYSNHYFYNNYQYTKWAKAIGYGK